MINSYELLYIWLYCSIYTYIERTDGPRTKQQQQYSICIYIVNTVNVS